MKKKLIARRLLVISTFLIFFSSVYSQTVGVFHNSTVPQLAFAAGDVKSALEKQGLRVEMRKLSTLNASHTGLKVVIAMQTDTTALDIMTARGGEAIGELGTQAYALRTTETNADLSCWIIGGDANGAMYGGLQVAEYITFHGLKGVHNEEDAPYIKRRGIKFNIPLDIRSPSFNDKGDAAKTNIKHMWDFSFWTEYFDVLARHRYNVISFWSKHPFTTMVKVPGYENVVMEDVRDHKGLVKTMSIEEKISFWQEVMQLAHDRGFEIYFINWNIFTSGASGKYGISNSRTNQTSIDYTRKSVYQFLKTYPLLTGIGVSAGENFGDASFAQREEWLYATFGEALWDYYREDPGRDITFIHRYLDSGVGSIMAEFKNLPKKYRIDISFKYTLGHLYTYHSPTYIYKTQDTRENVVAQLDTYNKKCWMNLRNDDLFYLRWGSPDYVRDYLTNFPDKEKYVAGYYMGSDGYVWGRVFSSENALFQGDLEVNKHWYRFMLWGRLGYNPNLQDSVFVNAIAARYGKEQAQQIFDAWNGGSKAFTTANSLIWWLWDSWWYPEGSKRAQGWRDVDDFINTSPPQGAPAYSITEYKNRLDAGDPMEKLSPLEVAAEIRAYSNTAVGTIIHRGDKEELRLISNDIKALGYLGLYFAEKIEGAVYHHLGQKSKAISHMQNAYWHWKSYTKIGDAMYKDQKLARTGIFIWGDYDDDALNDIKTVGGSGPGDNQFKNKFIITPTRPDRDKFPSFNKNKDLLLFQFDNRPDPDDIHSEAAVGSMIQHSDFDGVKTYAVLGATGTQGHEIINSSSLMKLIFGPEGSDTWTDARSFYEKDGNPNQAWIKSVERVRDIAKPILMYGGNVWVMEAGQSHITRDWIEALQANGISQDICKARIFVVQHSNWNHSHNRKEDLEFLKKNAKYIRIADGNRDTNDPGEENNDTPDFQTDDAEVKSHKELRSAAKTGANPNAATRAIWKEADRIIEEIGFHAGWSSISKGGLDFSDTSEAWWIMELGDNVTTLPEFWDRYVMAGEDDSYSKNK